MKIKYNINVIDKLVVHIPKTSTKAEVLNLLYEILVRDTILSYIVSRKQDYYYVQATYCQEECMNSLSTIESVAKIAGCILSDIENPGEKDVICYGQSNLDIMIRLYEPLISKLASEQHNKWSRYIEYDDLLQICKEQVCILYNKGYYIHRLLLYRTFNNAVLMYMKKIRHNVQAISLDEIVDSDDYGSLSIKDCIPDQLLIDSLYDAEEREYNHDLCMELKKIIVQFSSQRQYEQLLNSYGTKTTDAWSRKFMQKVKKELKQMNVTLKSLNDKINK